MNLKEPLYLMRGHTVHIRSDGISHRFRYRVTLIDIDVDLLDMADTSCRLFSIDRFNLVSFKTNSVGAKDEQTLSEWALHSFQSHNIKTDDCSIRLLTFPRTEFFTFSPLSVWRLLDKKGDIRALIYEVHNTFGERHCYVADLEKTGPRHIATKNFHVSPFFGIEGDYQFGIAESENAFELNIQNIVEGKRTHTATLNLKRQPVSNSGLVKFALSSPFAGIGVLASIHWEALKLLIKRAKYHPKPSVPNRFYTTSKVPTDIKPERTTSS